MHRFLLAWLTLFVTLSSAHAATIRFRQECGFSYAACGPVVTLEQDGDLYNYSTPWAEYSLAYEGDEFVMTALNDALPISGTPFGIAVYPASGPLVTLASPGSTVYGFIGFNAFPRLQGETRSVAILSLVGEVPEPGTLGMFVSGLGVVGWMTRRRKPAA